MAKVMAKVEEAVLSQSKLSQDISLVPCSSLISHHCQVLTPCVSILLGSLARVCLEVLVLISTVLLTVGLYDVKGTVKEKQHNHFHRVIGSPW